MTDNAFFPGRYSLDNVSSTKLFVENKNKNLGQLDTSSFSQSSFQQQSSYGSSNSFGSKNRNSRFDEAISAKRHSEVLESLRSIQSSMEQLTSTIASMHSKLKMELHSNCEVLAEQIARTVESSEIRTAMSFHIESNGADSGTNIFNNDSDSDHDGMCLVQYMKRKALNAAKSTEKG